MRSRERQRVRLSNARGALLCVLVAVLALVAACANAIPGSGRLVGVSITDQPSGSSSGAPTQTVSPSTSAYSSVCPNIIDNEARLAYRCIDDSLQVDPPTAAASGLTLALDVQTESQWVAMQGSGTADAPTGATAKLVAQNGVKQMLKDDYGDSPTSSTQSEGDVKLGRSAYRIDTLITLNPTYVAQRGLKAKQELLSITAVEVAQGKFSLMLITVPDTKKDWWANYDDVVHSLTVV